MHNKHGLVNSFLVDGWLLLLYELVIIVSNLSSNPLVGSVRYLLLLVVD